MGGAQRRTRGSLLQFRVRTAQAVGRVLPLVASLLFFLVLHQGCSTTKTGAYTQPLFTNEGWSPEVAGVQPWQPFQTTAYLSTRVTLSPGLDSATGDCDALSLNCSAWLRNVGHNISNALALKLEEQNRYLQVVVLEDERSSPKEPAIGDVRVRISLQDRFDRSFGYALILAWRSDTYEVDAIVEIVDAVSGERIEEFALNAEESLGLNYLWTVYVVVPLLPLYVSFNEEDRGRTLGHLVKDLAARISKASAEFAVVHARNRKQDTFAGRSKDVSSGPNRASVRSPKSNEWGGAGRSNDDNAPPVQTAPASVMARPVQASPSAATSKAATPRQVLGTKAWAPEQAGEKPILAVMEIVDRSGALDESDLASADDILRGLVAAAGRFVVVDKGRQDEQTRELLSRIRKETYKTCYSRNCQIPLGQSLAADSILISTISCIADECFLNVQLVDLAKEATVWGTNAQFVKGGAGLLSAIKRVGSALGRP